MHNSRPRQMKALHFAHCVRNMHHIHPICGVDYTRQIGCTFIALPNNWGRSDASSWWQFAVSFALVYSRWMNRCGAVLASEIASSILDVPSRVRNSMFGMCVFFQGLINFLHAHLSCRKVKRTWRGDEQFISQTFLVQIFRWLMVSAFFKKSALWNGSFRAANKIKYIQIGWMVHSAKI